MNNSDTSYGPAPVVQLNEPRVVSFTRDNTTGQPSGPECQTARPELSVSEQRSEEKLTVEEWIERFQFVNDHEHQFISNSKDPFAVTTVREGKIGTIRLIANRLWDRFMQSRSQGDLDLTIEFQAKLLDLLPDGDSRRPEWISKLGASYLRRCEYSSDPGDLAKSTGYFELATALTPTNDPGMSSLLYNIGRSYMDSFERLGKLENLEKAIHSYQLATSLIDDTSTNKPRYLSNLGTAYKYLFSRNGRQEDLEQAVNYQTQAVSLTPDDDSNKPT